MPSRSSKEARLGRYPNRNKKPNLGRTASERGLAKSVAASGRKVSRTNLGKPSRSPSPKPSKAPRARRSPLATPEVKSAVERLRSRYADSGRTVEEARRQTEANVRQRESRVADIAASQVKLDPAMSRTDFIGQQNEARKNTALSSDGKTVKRFGGKGIVGTPSTKSVARAAKEGSLRGKKKLTTPEVRQTTRQVKKARRQVRRARAQVARGGMPANVPAEYAKWIRKYSPRIDKQARATYGISGNEFMAKMLQGESGFDMSKVGPDTPYGNARGAAQFIPPTRDSFVEKFGIDPWRSPKEAVKAMALHLDGKSFSKTFGIQGYNPGINDSYYLNQDVGPTTKAAPGARKRLQKAKGKLQRLEDKAAELGLPTNRERQSGPVSWGPKKAKQLGGAWAGTEDILEKAGRGFDISSRKRDANDPLSLSNPGSDHNTANPDAYAHDIPAVGDENGIPIAEAYHKRLGLNEPLAIGTYNSYTSRKYPGYRFQVLWNVDGHFDHVHVGAKWTGEDLPAGTYLGGDTYTTGGSGVNIAAGGGGTAPASSGPTSRKRRQATILDRLRRPEVAAQLRQMGFRVTADGIFRANGENLSQTEFAKMKERFGIK